MKAGIVAAACAGLPLRSALAGNMLEDPNVRKLLPSTSSMEQLSYYTKSTFSPYVNTMFRVQLAPSNMRELKLTAIDDYPTSFSKVDVADVVTYETKTECFSLLLTMPPGNPFEQDTYLIEHDALGIFYMFVVPVSAQSKKSPNYYEAVVYRREMSLNTRWLTNTSIQPTINDTQPTVTAVPPQLIWNPGIVYGGVTTERPGVESPAKRGDTKEEQEIFYFRPLPIDPAIAENRTKERLARARRAASRLTMAQAAPAISGLKLGMTTEQVLALFPGSKDDKEVRSSLSRPASQFGESSLTIRPGKYSSKSKFDRISQIIFTLLDGRVSTFYVGYDGPVWEHVDEFVTKFSEEKSLPTVDSWEAYVGMDTQVKTLKCKDFEISLFAGGQNVEINYVQMNDLTAQQKLKERKAAAKKKELDESKRQASDPSKVTRERK
jgi:hypothetical protein